MSSSDSQSTAAFTGFSRLVLAAVIVIAVVGMLDSAYAAYQHYAVPGESACDFNVTVNCDVVNQSEYSEVAGVPVAFIGLAGYLFFAAVAGMALAWPRFRRRGGYLVLLAALPALAYSLYLTYIEIFVLGAVCPMCMLSLALVTTITVLAAWGAVRDRRAGAGPAGG